MNLLDLQRSPSAFRSALLIDTDSGPRPFSDIMDPWQATDFQALDMGWQNAAGQNPEGDIRQRAWLERPRGHSKSLDLAVMSTWALFASRRQLSGIAAAGDQDQARLLRDAIGKLVYVNPWLGKFIEVYNYRVTNPQTGSALDVITSDAPSSYGLTPDFIIADEVTHWRKRDLWDSLLSSAAKRSTCILVCISNAGFQEDWAWKTREAVRVDPRWHFSRLDGPQASWIDADALAEQQRLLPAVSYRRLWLNEWTSGGGDALTEEIINAAFRSDLQTQTAAVEGFEYVAGLDLGVSRDASAVCVLGVRRSHQGHGRIRLAATRFWKPSKGQRVNLQEVEDELLRLHQKFKLKEIRYDPWQAQHMASRLQSVGLGRIAHGANSPARLPMIEVPPSGQNLQRMATVLLEAFNDLRLELYPESNLHRDLTRLRVEERSYGFRLVSPRDEHGHGDMASAFQLALLGASELASKTRIVAGVLGSSLSPLEAAYERLQELNDYERYIANMEDSPPLNITIRPCGQY